MIKTFSVSFVCCAIFCVNAFAEESWEQIKNHGPHSGSVKMTEDHRFGLEVLPKDKGAYEVYALASNFDTISEPDLKITLRQLEDSKNKDYPCTLKDYFFICKLPSPPQKTPSKEMELTFKAVSGSLKVDREFHFQFAQ